MALKIGIDVGGTFTDFVLTRDSAEPAIFKTLSTPGDPSIAVVSGLADIAAAYPDAELFFIAGADAVSRLSEWREPARLMKLARFVGVARQGHAVPALSPPHLVVETPEVGVSSTEVRRRRRAGAPVRYLVPDAVAAYIAQHALYLGGPDV